MASQPVVLSDPRMLAEFMRQAEFKSFFETRFAVPPDYAALLFKNGELVDAYKGGHFSVGGLVDKLKGLVGGSTHVGMMIADLKPFSVETLIEGTSRDDVAIVGKVTMELQVDPDKPANILGLMHGIARAASPDDSPGRKALAKEDVLARIRPHIADRVGEAALRRMDAADIRGETGLQDKFQADIMQEVERVLGDLGILVRAVSVVWAPNEVEAQKMREADATRRQDELDHQLEMLKREIGREAEATEFQLKTDMDLARLQNASEDELRMMALNSEIEFADARETAKRRQELETLEHEIDFLKKERAATFENQLAHATQDVDLAKIKAKQLEVERDIEALNKEHQNALKKSDAFTEVEVTQRIQVQQAEHIARLNQIEQQASQAEFEMRMRQAQTEADIEIKKGQAATQNQMMLKNAEAKSRVDQFNAAKNMTPEQILAINAGLSPEVAGVLAEQARAQGAANQDTMKIMREMVDAASAREVRTADEALRASKIVMDGMTGVAQGIGGAGGGASGGGAGSDGATVTCPKCNTEMPAQANFCKGCGHQLRTT